MFIAVRKMGTMRFLSLNIYFNSVCIALWLYSFWFWKYYSFFLIFAQFLFSSLNFLTQKRKKEKQNKTKNIVRDTHISETNNNSKRLDKEFFWLYTPETQLFIVIAILIWRSQIDKKTLHVRFLYKKRDQIIRTCDVISIRKILDHTETKTVKVDFDENMQFFDLPIN